MRIIKLSLDTTAFSDNLHQINNHEKSYYDIGFDSQSVFWFCVSKYITTIPTDQIPQKRKHLDSVSIKYFGRYDPSTNEVSLTSKNTELLHAVPSPVANKLKQEFNENIDIFVTHYKNVY